MAVKKRNISTVNFSEKAMKVLQVMGYIDGRKKANKEKNLSAFVSGLIEDHIIFHPKLNHHEINMKIHVADLNTLRMQQMAIEAKVCETADKLRKTKELLKASQEH